MLLSVGLLFGRLVSLWRFATQLPRDDAMDLGAGGLTLVEPVYQGRRMGRIARRLASTQKYVFFAHGRCCLQQC
jgi:hypothetical protein